MQKKKDIMDEILEGQHGEVGDRIDQLDCLIFKKDETDDDIENDKPSEQEKKVWQNSKENLTVQVWEGKAKIKVKVSPGKNKRISMKRIANVAMNAILEELNKEE